jgi:hypothetical protein
MARQTPALDLRLEQAILAADAWETTPAAEARAVS